LAVKGLFEDAEHLAGEVAFEATTNLAVCLPVGSAFVEVGTSTWIVAPALYTNDVERGIEAAVSSSVETVASDEPGCQSARKFDPRSACNIDSPSVEGRGYSRCLKRQLSLPVSMMSQ
jgi:hypothetical protein